MEKFELGLEITGLHRKFNQAVQNIQKLEEKYDQNAEKSPSITITEEERDKDND